MAKGNNLSDYNTLLSEYNRLIARQKDLQTQITEKEGAWRELEKHYKSDDNKARKLCEMILAKDRNDNFLGQNYSWSSFSTSDIIDMAKVAYEKYNAERTGLLKTLQRTAEERRSDYENLLTQYEALKSNKGLSGSHSVVGGVIYDEETGEVLEPCISDSADIPDVPPQPKNNIQASESVMKSVDYKIQKAAKSGGIDVIAIEEEDGDVSIQDINHASTMATMRAAAQIEQSGLKISQSQKKINAVQKQAQAYAGSVMMDKDKIMKNMNERRLQVVQVIGNFGYCEGAAIVAEMVKTQPDYTMSHYANDFNTLLNNQVVINEKFTHPLRGTVSVVYLSEVGAVIYKDMNDGKEPAEAECHRIRRDHDNYEHGYGIVALKEILETSGLYSSVCIDRAENVHKLNDGSKYIPDAIAYAGKKKFFYEYELGTHKQRDFDIKMNKMASVAQQLNIITNNQKTVKDLKKKIDIWIESRTKNGGGLPNHIVRISSLASLRDAKDLSRDDSWVVVEPVIPKSSGTPGQNENKEPARKSTPAAPVTSTATSPLTSTNGDLSASKKEVVSHEPNTSRRII